MNENEEPIAVPKDAPEEEAPRVDLNSATEEELQQLPGIGPALAAAIVRYRTEVQPFREVAEITSVPGISRGLYESLAERLTVGAVEAAPESEPPPDQAEAEEAEPVEAEVEVEAAEAEAEEAEPPEVEAAEFEPEETEAGVSAEAEAGLPEAAPEPEAVEGVEAAAAPPSQPPHLVEVRTVHDVGWGRMLFVGLLSAILGAALALLILYVVNSYTLDVRTASDRALRAEALRLEGEIGALDEGLSGVQDQLAAMQDLEPAVQQAQADIESLGRELAVISSTMADLRQEFTNMREDLDGLTGQVGMLDERLRAVEGQMADLGEQLTVLSGQVETLQQAAERFDAFLDGLRRLLAETEPLKGTTPLPSATPMFGRTVTPQPDLTVIPLPTPTP